jgi:hypothetical protein
LTLTDTLSVRELPVGRAEVLVFAAAARMSSADMSVLLIFFGLSPPTSRASV